LYEIDTDIVLDWPRERQDRPKVLALPISSGSGQYRLVEPLDALQTAGLARTCVVFPRADRSLREPTVLEIARARPNTLIVQHSIGDHHFRRLRSIRRSCPDIFIVQMVDDLFRDLPTKHHLHNLHQREGELRMREAISLCDRLVVSTQPLADAYSAYCPDVRVMPNCLDEKAWDGLRRPARTEPRARLRVGWAGAMQHLDDLEMIADVVRELANDVDWIFMGMCPDVLRPYVKEFHPFVSYADYPAKLATLDLDIAIAPLQDNRFNESKSNLRLLEYGAMGWPVVCSDVYPFRTGNPPVCRLSNDAALWIKTVRHLIGHPAIRGQMANDLHQWVREQHFLMKRVHEWSEALKRPPQ
jgi:glycosyltransferase involved in cell wall biosynthesis